MSSHPENHCAHRISCAITFIKKTEATSDPQSVFEVTGQVTIFECALLLKTGAHVLKCIDSNISEEECPLPEIAAGEMSLDEGAARIQEIREQNQG